MVLSISSTWAGSQRQRVGGGLDGVLGAVEVADGEHGVLRLGHQADHGLGRDGQRPLGADDELRQVERRSRRPAGRAGSRRPGARTAGTRSRWPARFASTISGQPPVDPALEGVRARRGGAARPRRPARSGRASRRTARRRARGRGRSSCRSAREPLPAELLPIIPPMVARLLVEVSGPNISPYGAAARLSSSCTTPTSTRAVRASGSSSRIRSRCREQSSTRPGADGLAGQAGAGAARGDRRRRAGSATRTAAATSSACRGKTTPSGMIEYMLASRENRCRL